ncbi:hypothetical protein V8C86DRAFT_3098756 [Haematococcus lacustris]
MRTDALIAHGLAGLYVAAGIAAAPPVHHRQAAASPGPGQAAMCGVCYEAVPGSALLDATDCGHVFCAACWGRYLRAEIATGQANKLRTEASKYLDSLLYSFVEENDQAFCWKCGQATGTAHGMHSINGHYCGQQQQDLILSMAHAAAAAAAAASTQGQ